MTTAPGLDVDTMVWTATSPDDGGGRHAVRRDRAGKLLAAASRVPKSVREGLKIDLYSVDANDIVRQH